MTTSGSGYGATENAPKKRDPNDGHLYTFEEIQKFYGGKPHWWDHQDVLDFWDHQCEPPAGRSRTRTEQLTDLEGQVEEKEGLIVSLQRAMSTDKKAKQAEIDKVMRERASDKEKHKKDKEKTVMEKLKQLQITVEFAVNSFTSSPIFPFTWKKYFILNLMTFATVWIAGRNPADFWKWHLLNYVVLFPIQIYRWYMCQNIALMIEFCWVANFCMTIYLAVNFISPSALPISINGMCFRSIFAFAYGPFAFALLSSGNALVPHSINHQAQLLIHLQPLITAYELKYGATLYPVDHPVFPTNEDVGFLQFITPPLIFLLCQQCLHSAFFLTTGINWPPQWQTTFTAVFKKYIKDGVLNEGLYVQLFGHIGDGRSERLRSCKLDAAVTTVIAILFLPTYFLYSFKNGIPTLCILLLCLLRTFYEGAVWYESRIDNVNTSVNRMIEQEQKM